MGQLNMFTAAAAARDEALFNVENAAESDWIELAYQALLLTARTLRWFICDDVWDIGGLPPTRENRALGAVFKRAKRDGVIVMTGDSRPSVRSHLTGKPVWLSLIYKGGAPGLGC